MYLILKFIFLNENINKILKLIFSFIQYKPKTCNVNASTACELYYLNKKSFLEILK
jgi:hypothetical protein